MIKRTQGSVVGHYDSLGCVVVYAQVLFNSVTNLFERDGIPWHNLFIYLFIYFQLIYRSQILLQFKIRLVSHKQQDLSQTSGVVNDIFVLLTPDI